MSLNLLLDPGVSILPKTRSELLTWTQCRVCHTHCSLPHALSEHTTHLHIFVSSLCWSLQPLFVKRPSRTSSIKLYTNWGKINLSPMTLSSLHSKVDFTAVRLLVNTQVKWGSRMLCSSIKEHNLAFLIHESQALPTMPFHVTCNVQSAKFGKLYHDYMGFCYWRPRRDWWEKPCLSFVTGTQLLPLAYKHHYPKDGTRGRTLSPAVSSHSALWVPQLDPWMAT